MERLTALVTGASAGIGREFARLLANEGYDLVITARRADRLSELSAELQDRHGAGVLEISADLTDPEAPERLCRELHEAGHAIDLLVNNAGFGGVGRFESLDQVRQREMIDVNVTALTRLAGLLLPGMKSRFARRDHQRRLDRRVSGRAFHGGCTTPARLTRYRFPKRCRKSAGEPA